MLLLLESLYDGVLLLLLLKSLYDVVVLLLLELLLLDDGGVFVVGILV